MARGRGHASDNWFVPVGVQKYGGVNGQFGIGTACCGFGGAAPPLVDSEVLFHGVRVCETNYVTITDIPPDPRGANAIPGIPEGSWYFVMTMPTSSTPAPTYSGGASTVNVSFNYDIHGWQKIQAWVNPDNVSTPNTLVGEMEPVLGVNGGDIYCFAPNADADVVCDDLDNGNGEPPEPPEIEQCFDECEGGIFVETDECESGIYPC